MSYPYLKSFNQIWRDHLCALLEVGERIAPRGEATFELPHRTIVVDTRFPVLTVAARSLSYRFMAAEAYWILDGDDRLATIAPWNSRIARYSDDGETFFGAYGPRYVEQLPGVVQKLIDDPSTRQAGLTLWQPNPPATKDVPCTIAMFFQLRQSNKLNAHVFMRSSDAWLGLPYDVFNFSMITHQVAAYLNARRVGDAVGSGTTPELVVPGYLHLTMASAHLYARDEGPVRLCLRRPLDESWTANPTPVGLYRDLDALPATLTAIRDGTRLRNEARWWEA